MTITRTHDFTEKLCPIHGITPEQLAENDYSLECLCPVIFDTRMDEQTNVWPAREQFLRNTLRRRIAQLDPRRDCPDDMHAVDWLMNVVLEIVGGEDTDG